MAAQLSDSYYLVEGAHYAIVAMAGFGSAALMYFALRRSIRRR